MSAQFLYKETFEKRAICHCEEAIQKELGFVPQYDLKAGWIETIRERQVLSAEDCVKGKIVLSAEDCVKEMG